MKWINELLQKEKRANQKYYAFLETVKIIRKYEEDNSYSHYISELIPMIEKNIRTFDEHHDFLDEEIREYADKLQVFWDETLKYQVWLAGQKKDCEDVCNILNNQKVHICGFSEGISDADDKYDYIIMCSNIAKPEILEKIKKSKIIRYDFMKHCAYDISPESAYLDRKLRKKAAAGGLEGVVTGLSYHERGIIFDKLDKNMVCLATPGQDLFLDYHNFLWFYRKTLSRQETFKYCIIGMDFYRLWYDLSLSPENRHRMLFFYRRLKNVHHFHSADSLLSQYEEDLRICDELMADGYADIDYKNNGYSEAYYEKASKKQYEMTDETYEKDVKEIQKLFHKPYPATFKENKGILERFLKFLHLHNIKTLIFIPPFPEIFNENTPEDMRQTTLAVLEEMKERYEFDILDISNDHGFPNHYFTDCSHLNSTGAEFVTEILNSYMKMAWNE